MIRLDIFLNQIKWKKTYKSVFRVKFCKKDFQGFFSNLFVNFQRVAPQASLA
jgi:hypothetical protein